MMIIRVSGWRGCDGSIIPRPRDGRIMALFEGDEAGVLELSRIREIYYDYVGYWYYVEYEGEGFERHAADRLPYFSIKARVECGDMFTCRVDKIEMIRDFAGKLLGDAEYLDDPMIHYALFNAPDNIIGRLEELEGEGRIIFEKGGCDVVLHPPMTLTLYILDRVLIVDVSGLAAGGIALDGIMAVLTFTAASPWIGASEHHVFRLKAIPGRDEVGRINRLLERYSRRSRGCSPYALLR